MKKSVFVYILLMAIMLPIQAQKVSNMTYKLDNGILVKMERGWGNVWVQQTQAAFKPDDDKHSVDVVVRSMGDLLAQGTTSSKLSGSGKDVKMTDTPPGTYDLKITSKLSGKPGIISFDVPGIVVKPQMKTTVNVTIYDYQINIDEVPLAANGLASFESGVIKFKGNSDQSPKCGIPTFYVKGVRDKSIAPNEKKSDLAGKINPGTYDVQLSLEVCGSQQKIWLENFTLKPNILYKITTNLNAGEITYAGTIRDVKKLHMYPAGTADKMQGAAKPDKALERIVYEPATLKWPCQPGSYDVLVNIGNGAKYEWRKGVVIRTGTSVPIK